MNTIIAAEETSRGWGGPVALLAAVAVFVAYATLLDSWQRRRDHSPTPGGDTPGVRAKPQVNHGSDTDDTADEPDGEPGRQGSGPGAWLREFGRALWAREEPVDDDLGDAEPDDDRPETIEETITRLDEQGTPYAAIVRAVVRQHRVSVSTAKRRIRQVRAPLAG